MSELLPAPRWQARMSAHEQRAESLTHRHLERRYRGEKHPVFDFLFEYYPIRPAHLRRWHPGIGVRLEGQAPQLEWRDYILADDGTTTVDIDQLWARRSESFRYIRTLLHRTNINPAHFDCFGLHEWAMVYRTDNPRHDLPLRLGPQGSDAVVEKHRIRCSHFDAFRFFTPPARSLNIRVLNREDQPEYDQAGCVHATMDLYKWAAKLGPLVPGELFLDTFELAVDARVLDMEASPYDCRDFGLGVVAIETPEGKAAYIDRQRALAERGKPLRDRLVALIDQAEAATLAA
ncbi:3-methyladenine DNA glycosylase [Corynebacterium alimapuense]|uniref:3-methyladenine DNA glycosylase n=1 Tax=Corynebacterium alimapuense TaxID=1576874 RepID=A0A3M8K7I8_9CORY|nr:3-methyladenine DNA glycosylase [Corynebacterium alimapuense]RNE49116.1 3-methyladenine DNA glycosylase [Corynebacterium alimapuense]